MTKQQTLEFIKKWNELNNFPDGICNFPNMRYVKRGVVTWNEYNAPELDLIQVRDLLKEYEND